MERSPRPYALPDCPRWREAAAGYISRGPEAVARLLGADPRGVQRVEEAGGVVRLVVLPEAPVCLLCLSDPPRPGSDFCSKICEKTAGRLVEGMRRAAAGLGPGRPRRPLRRLAEEAPPPGRWAVGWWDGRGDGPRVPRQVGIVAAETEEEARGVAGQVRPDLVERGLYLRQVLHSLDVCPYSEVCGIAGCDLVCGELRPLDGAPVVSQGPQKGRRPRKTAQGPQKGQRGASKARRAGR